jgi:serine/threonine-protein kinase
VTAPVLEGQVLAGKYRVERVLGMGGMGVVVAAQHLQLDDRVAIKFLLPGALANQETVARFAREARAAVKIKSEHIARVIDVGTLANGAPYMVMEYLEGSDLAAWLKQMGVLSIDMAVEFILQACEAIAEAHALGIVHRDLKPANLFVIRRPDGTLMVKVLDFGISKTTGVGGPSAEMTHTSAVMGSPLYMSSEQLRASKTADSRSDVWALGVILFELVTGRLPFAAESLPELIHQIMNEEPLRVRAFLPDAPVAFERAISKCLEKDREKRHQSVGALSVALLPFGTRRSRASVERISGVLKAAGLSGTGFVPPSSNQENNPAETAASWGRTNSKTITGNKRLFGIAALTLIAFVFGVRFAYKASTPAKIEPVASAPALLSAVPEAPRLLPSIDVAPVPEPTVTANAPDEPVPAPSQKPPAPASSQKPSSNAVRPHPRAPAPASAPPAVAPPVSVHPAAPPAAQHPTTPTTGWGGRL